MASAPNIAISKAMVLYETLYMIVSTHCGELDYYYYVIVMISDATIHCYYRYCYCITLLLIFVRVT